MKNNILGIIVMLVLVLAGCGGNSSQPDIVPAPTATPALTLEERVTFGSGTFENPLRMLVYPTDAVWTRLVDVLVDELGVRRSQLQPDSDLREDLGLDENLDALAPSLMRDFGISLDEHDIPDMTTLADLVIVIQIGIGEQVREALFERTALHIEVLPVSSYADALSALCDSGSGLVTLPWLDGITYAAAAAQNCGQPGLRVLLGGDNVPLFLPTGSQLEGEVTPETSAEVTPESTPETEAVTVPVSRVRTGIRSQGMRSGSAGMLIAGPSVEADDLTVVTGATFCRLAYDDLYSWVLPSLLMQTNGIDLQRAPATVIDMADQAALVRAVANGRCGLAGISRDALNASADSNLRVLAETVDFPYAVLMYPVEVGLGVRLSLNEHLPALAQDAQQGRSLRLLLGQDDLEPVRREDFVELDTFMAATGLNFAQLGD